MVAVVVAVLGVGAVMWFYRNKLTIADAKRCGLTLPTITVQVPGWEHRVAHFLSFYKRMNGLPQGRCVYHGEFCYSFTADLEDQVRQFARLAELEVRELPVNEGAVAE